MVAFVSALVSPTHPNSPAPLPAAVAALLDKGGFDVESAERLHGDVSERTYFRLRIESGGTLIAVHYPVHLREACRRFVASSGLLEGAGIRAPRIQQADCERGSMLLEDLGEGTLFELRGRPWTELRRFLEHAVEIIAALQALAVARVEKLANAPLDRSLLAAELERTWGTLLEPRRLVAEPQLARTLRAATEEICEVLGSRRRVPCHRDFMARNLVPVGEPPGLAVLDHQDLRLGPAAYDLASLLNDSLFVPPPVEASLLERALPALGIERQDYHRAAIQRLLKAAGTFASPRGRRHEALIAPSLQRAVRHLGALAPWRGLAARLRESWARL